MRQPDQTQASGLPEIEASLQSGALRQVLAELNRSGNHRYTGLFAFEGSHFQNAYLFDREQLHVERMEKGIPYEATYCSFVAESLRTFILIDSFEDPRVANHPSRQAFRSYAGVPIHAEDGSFWGTLCFFDTRPNPVSPEQIELLLRVGELLRASHLQLAQEAPLAS